MAARVAFERYLARYDAGEPRIRLKIAHTHRVAALCERIAESLGLSREEVDLAWTCGLLHDIGRFEQVRRFGTYNDSVSVDHARLGAKILFGENTLADGVRYDGDMRHAAEQVAPDARLLRAFVPDAREDALVHTVVETHGDFRLPARLDRRTRRFCDIVRDADKIDILHVNCNESVEAIYGVSEKQMRESPLSANVEEAFFAHRTVLRGERTHPADLVASHLCFVFELVVPESVRIAQTQGDALALASRPFDNGDTATEFARMKRHLSHWFAQPRAGLT